MRGHGGPFTLSCSSAFRRFHQPPNSSVYSISQEAGPALTRPYADTIDGSKYRNMRELRIQHQRRPYRVLYAFDPRRTGVLLIGGDKTGNKRWYEEFVPRADVIYAQRLREIE